MEGSTIPFHVGTLVTKLYLFPGVGGVRHFSRPFCCTFYLTNTKTGFPDCEGKRCIDINKNLWEPVSIEFEFKSRNFLEHGHNPNECDMIVCWIHDWLDCPLEVIELKKILEESKTQNRQINS